MHKIASAAMFMSLALASFVAFQVFLTVDEVQPAGTQSAFSVVEVSTPTKDAAIDIIAETAREQGHNIFKVQPDPRESRQARVLFAFVGDADVFASHGGVEYPEFSTQQVRTRVLAADAITTEDLRGRYVTSASAEQLPELLTTLGEAGIEARDDTVSGVVVLGYSAGQGNLAASFVIMLVALALSIFHSVARNRKVYALKALHGYRPISNLRTEIVSATARFGVGVVGLVVLGLPTLAVYNQLHQASRFSRILAATLVVLYIVVVALIALAVWSLPRLSIPQVLKGEQASLRIGVLAAGAQVAILAVVLSTTSASMSRIEAIQDSLDISHHWLNGDPLYALRLGASGTPHEDELRAGPGLSRAISDLEASRQVLLVSYTGQVLPEDTQGRGGIEGTAPLIVNNEYLERQLVRDADQHRIADLPEGEDTFTLLVPKTYPGDPEELLQRYVAYFRDFSCLVGRDDEESFSCDPRGTIILTEPGQDLFTYNGTTFLPAQMQHDPMFLHDPVVAVVTAVSGLISPVLYVSYASQDDVLFSDPAMLDTALQEYGAREVFQGIDNAADAVATARALSIRELRTDTVGLVLGCIALILASIIMAVVYCDRRKRPMFVQLIHGYSFGSRHWGYLTATVLLSIAGVGIAGLVGGSMARGRDIIVATAFVTAQSIISVVAIRTYESRFRADLIKRS